jgi:hypothetical protein
MSLSAGVDPYQYWSGNLMQCDFRLESCTTNECSFTFVSGESTATQYCASSGIICNEDHGLYLIHIWIMLESTSGWTHICFCRNKLSLHSLLDAWHFSEANRLGPPLRSHSGKNVLWHCDHVLYVHLCAAPRELPLSSTSGAVALRPVASYFDAVGGKGYAEH